MIWHFYVRNKYIMTKQFVRTIKSIGLLGKICCDYTLIQNVNIHDFKFLDCRL